MGDSSIRIPSSAARATISLASSMPSLRRSMCRAASRVNARNPQWKSLTGVFQGLLLFTLLACDTLIAYRVRFTGLNRQGAR